MKRLLDPSFHRVVIDGIDDPRRAGVWDAMLKSEHFVDTQVVHSKMFNCIGTMFYPIAALLQHHFFSFSFFSLSMLCALGTKSMGRRDSVYQ